MPYTDTGTGYRQNDTSHAAAVAIDASTATIRTTVLRYMRGCTTPVSADDVAEALNLDGCRVKPRMTELKNDGRIVDSGHRGQTRYGRSCILWVVAPAQGDLPLGGV